MSCSRTAGSPRPDNRVPRPQSGRIRSPASRQTARTRHATRGQRAALASTTAQIRFTRLAMDATVAARPRKLKMPRLDAYS